MGIENINCILNSTPLVSLSDENGSVTYSEVYLYPHTLTLTEGTEIELARFELGFEESEINSITIDNSGTSVFATVADNFQTINITIQYNGNSWEMTEATIEEELNPIQNISDNQDAALSESLIGKEGIKKSEKLLIWLIAVMLAIAIGLAIGIISDFRVIRWYNSMLKKNNNR